jgi:N-acetyl sugar amidotransferase
VDKIKLEGEGKEFDCIIGVSGGVDSSTVAYWVWKLGLRALAVHLDNGWDAEMAVGNIWKLLDIPNIELFTHVVDWEEFRDIQMSFLKASVPNCEIPTDHGIFALLWQMARKENVRYLLTGSNVVTEAIMPYAWGHYNQDLKHLKAIHRRFGNGMIRTLPTISLSQYVYDVFVRGIRQIPFLNYFDYKKEEAKQTLEREMNWCDYGAKHYESVWTRFFQGYYLPVKFGFDKRKAHLSSMICSGQISREEALSEMISPPYSEELLREDMRFVKKKFNLTDRGFKELMETPPRKHTEFPSHYFLFHRMAKYKNIFRKIATSA